jgi:hypothetical protein
LVRKHLVVYEYEEKQKIFFEGLKLARKKGRQVIVNAQVGLPAQTWHTGVFLSACSGSFSKKKISLQPHLKKVGEL